MFMLMQLQPAGTAYTYTERIASRAVMLRIDSSLNLPAAVKTTVLHDTVTPVITLAQTTTIVRHAPESRDAVTQNTKQKRR